MSDERVALAADAFIDGFPLVFDLREVGGFIRDGIGGAGATPFNRFGHATELADPEATFVSINNDTVYSIAQVDLSAGPVRLDVPDAAGRYDVSQFVDGWTNNFAYVGHRATGTSAGSCLLVPPDGEGAPGGALRHELLTRARTGCRHRPATSDPSCACTSPTRPSSTDATNSRRSRGPPDRTTPALGRITSRAESMRRGRHRSGARRCREIPA